MKYLLVLLAVVLLLSVAGAITVRRLMIHAETEERLRTALREVEKLQRSLDNPRAALDAALAAEAEAKRTYENTLNAAPDPDKKAILEARLENAKAQAEILAKFQTEWASTFTSLTREAKAQIQGAMRQALETNRHSLMRVTEQELKQIEEMRKADGTDIEHVVTQLKWALVFNMTASFMTLASVWFVFLL